MKKILLLFILFVTISNVQGQNPLIRKDIILKTGLGFSKESIPIYLGIDYGLTNEMSIGGEFSNNITRSVLFRAIKVRWDYHFKKFLVLPERWDIFAGVGIGAFMHENKKPLIDLTAQVGISYFFSYKFGINLEYGAGYAFTGPRIGVALKF